MLSRRKFVERGGQLIIASCLFPEGLFAQSKKLNDTINYIKNKYSGKTLNLLYPKGSLANVSVIANSFFQQTGVKVVLKEAELNSISSEMILDSSLKGRDQNIDVALPATYGIPDLVEKKAILNLSEYANKFEPANYRIDCLYNRGDFYKGRFYGYQTDGDVYLMFYNNKISEKYRVIYENRYQEKYEVPKTWDKFDEQVKFFHKQSSKVSGGVLPRNNEFTIYEFWLRLHSFGFYPLNDDFSSRLTSEYSVEALKNIVELSKYLDPTTRTNDIFDNFEIFSQGNSFSNLGWGGTQKYLMGPKSKVKNSLTYSATPGGINKGKQFNVPYFNWGWNYVVSSRTTKEELAFLFCLFASSPQASADAIKERDGYFDPYRSSHYEDKRIIDLYGSEFLKVHYESLKSSIPDFYVSGNGLYTSALQRGISLSLQGYLEPEKSLKLVSEKWEKITDRIGREQQIKQWKFLKKSYPKNLKAILK